MPLINASITDIVLELKQATTVAEVNRHLQVGVSNAAHPDARCLLEYFCTAFLIAEPGEVALSCSAASIALLWQPVDGYCMHRSTAITYLKNELARRRVCA